VSYDSVRGAWGQVTQASPCAELGGQVGLKSSRTYSLVRRRRRFRAIPFRYSKITVAARVDPRGTEMYQDFRLFKGRPGYFKRDVGDAKSVGPGNQPVVARRNDIELKTPLRICCDTGHQLMIFFREQTQASAGDCPAGLSFITDLDDAHAPHGADL